LARCTCRRTDRRLRSSEARRRVMGTLPGRETARTLCTPATERGAR
jgi:hypothetical protein